MITKRMVSCLVVAAGMLAMSNIGNAAFFGPTMDSSLFQYKYEMDVMPSTQDLDTNSITDYVNHGANSVAGGILTTTGGGSNYVGAEDAGNIWRNSMGSGDYTIEFSAKVISDTGNVGSFLFFAANNPGVGGTASITIGDTDVRWLGSFGGPAIASGVDNTDAFHAYRLVKQTVDNAPLFYVWRDGVLVGDGEGPNGNYDAMYFGGGSGEVGGTTQVDFLRMTIGAYGPPTVPEPSSMAIIASLISGLIAFPRGNRK